MECRVLPCNSPQRAAINCTMKRYYAYSRLRALLLLILFGYLVVLIAYIQQYHNNSILIQDLNNLVRVAIPFRSAIAKQSVDILPRAAYFDRRIRGRHKNATVVLAHINKLQHNHIIACKVDGYLIKSFEIKSLEVNIWVHHEHPDCTHDDVMIFCYDTPAVENSKVSILYLNPQNRSEYIDIAAEYPLLIPKQISKFRSTVMTCTTVFDTPPHFGAWLRYQKTLGVHMVHINAQESFLNSSAFNDEFLLESLHSGFIEMTIWKEHLNPGASFYHSQALYYQNCLYRYIGVYNYCICADTDDFLTLKYDKDIHKVFKKIFHQHSAVGSTKLHWIQYDEPSEGFDPPEKEIKDGNLTRYVDSSHSEQCCNLYRSIYKLSAMVELGIHNSKQFLPYYHFRETTTPTTVAYMAHIKKTPI